MRELVRLNLGCGRDRKEGWVNVDFNKDVKPDVVHDLNKVPFPFKDNSVDFIEAKMLLEHLEIEMPVFFREIYRILKPNGKMRFTCPNMYSLPNRINIFFGKWASMITGWHPFHIKFLHPDYLNEVLFVQGFGVERKPLSSWRRTIDFTIRKRP